MLACLRFERRVPVRLGFVGDCVDRPSALQGRGRARGSDKRQQMQQMHQQPRVEKRRRLALTSARHNPKTSRAPLFVVCVRACVLDQATMLLRWAPPGWRTPGTCSSKGETLPVSAWKTSTRREHLGLHKKLNVTALQKKYTKECKKKTHKFFCLLCGALVPPCLLFLAVLVGERGRELAWRVRRWWDVSPKPAPVREFLRGRELHREQLKSIC